MPDPVGKSPSKANLLERMAANYVARKNGIDTENLRAISREGLTALRRIERRAIVWSSVAGLVAGGVIGAVEIVYMQGRLDDMRGMSLLEQAPHWIWFLAFILLMSGAEVLFLYWNALRATASASRIAGLALRPETERSSLLARALGRAAIELPNPLEAIHGIDPYARMPKWRIWVWRFLYRLKIGVTSFFLRVFLRRVIGRTFLRVLIPLFAGPLYAIWNGVITWRITREVRARIFGPFAAHDLIGRIETSRNRIRPEYRPLLVSAVAEVMILSKDAHPGFDILLSGLLQTLDLDPSRVEVDWRSQRELLREMNVMERAALLEAATLACLLDGRITKGEREFLVDAHARCERPFARETAKAALEAFLNGQGLRAFSVDETSDLNGKVPQSLVQ